MKRKLLEAIKSDDFIEIRNIFHIKLGFCYPVLRWQDMKYYNMFITATRYRRMISVGWCDVKNEKRLYFLGLL